MKTNENNTSKRSAISSFHETIYDIVRACVDDVAEDEHTNMRWRIEQVGTFHKEAWFSGVRA